MLIDNYVSLYFFGPELTLIVASLLIAVLDMIPARGRRAAPTNVSGSPARGATGVGEALEGGGDTTPEDRARQLAGIALVALGISAVMSLWNIGVAPRPLFDGLLAFDPFANFFRFFFAIVTMVVIVMARPQPEAGGGAAKGKGAGEFYSLLLTIALGMNLMALSRNLLMIYLSLEIVSVISFVMAAFRSDDRRSSEGALKYVIFGGASSGVMLYGMSWLFGSTGSLDLAEIARSVTQNGIDEATIVAVVCILAGFGYKISAAPFHMWAPDVYEGAPTPVTAFLSVGPKAAGFAAILRFFHDALGTGAALDANAEVPWPMIIGILAIATMTVGNFSALGQKSVKRMLAYSSIAHAGYMLLGVVAFSDRGASAVVFYIAVYCFMNLGAFLVVLAVAEKTGKETIDAYEGLGFRAPGIAAAMAIFLFSLTGLPPMAGFVGKFYLFSALVERGGDLNAFLAVVGVLNSVVSLFYYARVLKAMYLSKPAPGSIVVRTSYGWTVGLLAVPTLVLGLYWAPVYDFISGSLGMLR